MSLLTLEARGAVNAVTAWQLGNAAAGIKSGAVAGLYSFAAVVSVDVVGVGSFVCRR